MPNPPAVFAIEADVPFQAVDAIDPLESDIGRLRAANLAKKRAR